MFRTVLFALVLSAPLRAEERVFTVTLDGKAAGGCTLTIETRDGTTTVMYMADRSTAEVRDARRYQGTEVWKHDRLVRLEASAAADSRTTTVAITGGRDGFALKFGAKDVTVRAADIWPTPYWTLPESARRGAMVVDVESGEAVRAKVEKFGADRVTASGKTIPATRFRVTSGGATTDLWFDAANRLVRRAWTVDGRAAVMELTRLKTD